MKAPRFKALGAILLSTALIATVAGCDLNEDADVEGGRDLFIANCGTCHALAESGQTAQIGPDLDASFAAARATGMDQDTIEGIVTAQIGNPRETSVDDPTYMPANILEGQEADDVAAYVASVAGVPGIEAPVAPGGPGGQVFANNGCAACHVMAVAESNGAVGPSLDENLPNQSEAMIRQSIVDPAAELVQGFANLMPAGYGDSIEPADLDLLVEFLSECSGEDPDDPNLPAACTNEGGGGAP